MGEGGPGRVVHQLGSETAPFSIHADVKIVDQRAPGGVSIEDDVDESDEDVFILGHDRGRGSGLRGEALSPDLEALRHHVAVEEGIRKRAPIVQTPTFGVEPSNGLGVPGLSIA